MWICVCFCVVLVLCNIKGIDLWNLEEDFMVLLWILYLGCCVFGLWLLLFLILNFMVLVLVVCWFFFWERLLKFSVGKWCVFLFWVFFNIFKWIFLIFLFCLFFLFFIGLIGVIFFFFFIWYIIVDFFIFILRFFFFCLCINLMMCCWSLLVIFDCRGLCMCFWYWLCIVVGVYICSIV